MNRVIVYGSINVDTTVVVDDFPLPGQTIRSSGVHTSPGGKGLNQAVAAARMGAATHMVGAVGTDTAAEALLTGLRAESSLDLTRTRRVNGPTGQAFITRDGAGENTIVITSGANGAHTAQTALEDLAFLERGDVLVCQLEIGLDAVRAALAHGREQGATTVLNAAPAADVRALLDHVNLLVVNETEADALIAAGSAAPIDDPLRAATHLHRESGTGVVLTLGAGGLVYCAEEGAGALPAVPVTPVDTTGAGDAFVGALAAMLAEGSDLAEALEFASALGALACTAAGAQGYTADRQAVADLL